MFSMTHCYIRIVQNTDRDRPTCYAMTDGAVDDETQFCVSVCGLSNVVCMVDGVQVDEVVNGHLQRLMVEDTESWQCIADQGDLKVFKRELEENGIVLDPLKAVCTVKVSVLPLTVDVFHSSASMWSH